MTFDVFSALILTICLLCFFMLNLLNLLLHSRSRAARKYLKDRKHKPPKHLIMVLAAFGTIVYWLEVLLYPFLVFTDLFSMIKVNPLQIDLPYSQFLRWLGLGLLVFGFFLFSWSVLTREKHAVSWEMPENHVLVTWGPYGLVRHPSYLSYFIMFFGIFFLWLNFLAAIPLIAIPGYISIVEDEERMLVERFRDDYLRYQESVGKFIPKLKKKKN
ncbi:MAG: hypothetical protein DRO00_03300 [Thermoproteota archaeon]|nr:MAG: hypothetical protein DRO00_03300 [Candidatus Korarchaeota archaeon]